MKTAVTILLIIGIAFSIHTRRKMMLWRSNHGSGALAKAITQLVGTAGGIYLSLELLLTFLGLPEEIWNPQIVYQVKPLAVISLFIAIIQPYAQKVIGYIRQGRN